MSDLAAARELRRQKILNKSADRLGKITSLKSNTQENTQNVEITYSTSKGESIRNEITESLLSNTVKEPNKESVRDSTKGDEVDLPLDLPLDDLQENKTVSETPTFFTFRTLLMILLGILTVYVHDKPHLWVHSPSISVPFTYGQYEIEIWKIFVSLQVLFATQEVLNYKQTSTLMDSLLSFGIPIPSVLRSWSLGSSVWIKVINSFYDDVYTYIFVLVLGMSLSNLL